jgi:hypothetical protein
LISFYWRIALPDGWTIISISGAGLPSLHGTDSFLTAQILPTTPFSVVYTIQVPLTENRNCELGSSARYKAEGMVKAVVSNGDSLTLAAQDVNSNGMADSWESHYAGVAGSLDPNADLDRDRMSNFAEYLCGTEPDNAASLLQMVALNVRADDTSEVSWSSVAGRVYTLQRADGTPASANFMDIVTNIAADPSGRNVYTNAVDQKTPHFFRVKLQ